MKTKQILLLLSLFLGIILISCAEEKEEAKPEPEPKPLLTVTGVTVETINASNKMFRNPVFTQDGSKLFFSSTVNTGLWIHDLVLDSTYRLNEKTISSGNYTSNQSGNVAIFIHSSYDRKEKKRNFFIGTQSLKSDSVKNIYSSIRRLNQLQLTSNNHVTFFERDSLMTLNIKSGRNYDWHDWDVNVLKASKNFIIAYSNGIVNRFNVVEKGNVLWPQFITPTEYLFNAPGKGTFRFDKITGEIKNVGNFQRPIYNSSNNFLVYLKEKSDGHTVSSSHIFLQNLDGGKSVQIDPENNYIEENPSWSPDGKQIVYNTVEGKIQLARIEFAK